MASREICDVKHPCIKDADSLWIFSYKDRKFIKINRSEYPKTKGTICQLCPNGLRRTNDSVISCGTKVETWSTLKGHLVTVERWVACLGRMTFPEERSFRFKLFVSIFAEFSVNLLRFQTL